MSEKDINRWQNTICPRDTTKPWVMGSGGSFDMADIQPITDAMLEELAVVSNYNGTPWNCRSLPLSPHDREHMYLLHYSTQGLIARMRLAEKAIAASEARVAELEAKTACTMGVGDGSGRLFVHGDYESIKAAQRIVERVAELEANCATTDNFRHAERRLREAAESQAAELRARCEGLAGLLREVSTSRQMLLYGDAWIARIDALLAEPSAQIDSSDLRVLLIII